MRSRKNAPVKIRSRRPNPALLFTAFLVSGSLLKAVAGGLLAHGAVQDRLSEREKKIAAAFQPFGPKVKTRSDDRFFYVESNGMPDHKLMVGITNWQQQVPLPQRYSGQNAWQFPLNPVPTANPLSAKSHFFRGAMAIAANGVPIFNALNNRGEDSYRIGELDEFGGHCGRADDYHYHIAPMHLQQIVGKDKPIGYALDGYALYGLTEPDGTPAANLDTFNGHTTAVLGYHYHSTKTYPYLNGGFHGEVTEVGGQVDPQPRAQPARPDTPPLRGAKITAFEQPKPGAYSLTYTLDGETRKVDYTVQADGSTKFDYVDGRGQTTTETYGAPRGGGGGQANTRPFQTLHIPEAISGTEFRLDLHKTKKSFWAGATTAAYAFNSESFWGPTLIFNQGDTVRLNVRNDLDEPTTTHWHGLHIPAAMDGGPHQLIPAGKTWSPTFQVKNRAGTYWYHPHPHESTQKQLTYGAGGLIIIRDPIEAKLDLPRKYGVDDIPLALTSRRFYANDQFSFEGDNDKYGDFLFANGTLDPQVGLPAQFVRLRILNAEIERGYILGFSDNRTYYVVATDGGLVDKPIPLKRMKLMVGERVEILVDLGADKVGSSLDLMAYNSNQPFGFPGGEPGRGRPNGGYLNNIDFRLLHVNVIAPTPNPVTRLPESLVKSGELKEGDAVKKRTLQITADRPGQPFTFDYKPYRMNATNQTVKLGDTEMWTVTNNRIFGHSFHIHDVQFRIVSRSSGPVEEYEKGWKDTVYVPRDRSVTFIARFEDFASETDPYMYHCHMANHEDGGLMGQFLVVKDPSSPRAVAFREMNEHPVTAEMDAGAERRTGTPAPDFAAPDTDGNAVSLKSISSARQVILFFIEKDCPCSKDAAAFINEIQTEYSSSCRVVGVINTDAKEARAWAEAANCGFSLIPDPNLKIINLFSAERSVTTMVFTSGAGLVKTYPGYGREMLNDLSTRMARLGGVPVRPIDFTSAPAKSVAGCPFADARKVATKGTPE